MWWKLILTAITSAPAERIVAMILNVLVKRHEAAQAKVTAATTTATATTPATMTADATTTTTTTEGPKAAAAQLDVDKSEKALEKIYKASMVAYSLTASGAALIQKMQAVDPDHTTTEAQYAEIGKAALECWAQAKSTPEEFVKLWKKPEVPV